MKILIGILFTFFVSFNVFANDLKETITFPSKDSLLITADTYIKHKDKNVPFIILFHQAGWSRGEYLEIAPQLNDLGFNCIAIDQRSGGEVNEVKNETFKRAAEKGKGTNYADALQDIEAALRYVRKNYKANKYILWGSSYSASLVLKVAGDNPDLVGGVLAFAPGEYFEKQGKPATWIQDSARKIKCPVFITSAKDEKSNWYPIYTAIEYKEKVSFLPETEGNHGSRALWEKFEDSKAYWDGVKGFLKKFK